MKLTSPCFKGILILFSFLIFSVSTAQVGIGTTSPNPDALLDVDATLTTGGMLLPRIALSSTASFAPLSAHVAGMIIYNTVAVSDVTPGLYFNDGAQWISASGGSPAAEPPIDAVSLGTDQIIVGATYTDVPGMSLTFTARKTSVMLMLTASGIGLTGSISNVGLRVVDSGSGTSYGGTNTKVQNLTLVTYRSGGTIFIAAAYSTTAWSANFSKLLTGLTVGTNYTIKVQGNTGNVFGTDGAAVNTLANPDSDHMTLSVIQ